VFIFVIVFLYIVNKIIQKEFWNYVRVVIVYRVIVDILIFVIIFSIYKFNHELFCTITVYFSPSILGSIYLLDMSYFNSIFLRSVENVPSLLDYIYKYLSRKPIEINIKFEPVKPLLKITTVKDLNLKIKDEIIFKKFFIFKNQEGRFAIASR